MKRIQHWIIWLLTAIWRSAKWLVTATWCSLKWVAQTSWSGVQALAKATWWLARRPAEGARKWEVRERIDKIRHWIAEATKGWGFDCPQGNHSSDAPNTWVDPEGRRHCRTCLSFAGTPAPPRERAPSPYRWWKATPSGRIRTHVGRYDNEAKMDAEIASASNFGWTVKNISTISSHINVGRTVAPMVLTGGLSLLKGASRSKEKYIVTFEHDGRKAEAA